MTEERAQDDLEERELDRKDEARDEKPQRRDKATFARRDASAIREEDTEPYTALQYVAVLFKVAALVVVVALTAEIVAGIALEGTAAIFPLLGAAIRGVVLAAILWGAGDLVLLFIDVGHDVRAERVLLGRLSARLEAVEPSEAPKDRPGDVRL